METTTEKTKDLGLDNKPIDVKMVNEPAVEIKKLEEIEKAKHPEFGPENIFAFHYRARFRPTEDIIVAKDIQDARQKAIDYCNRFGITFISVRPFILDLNKKPRDTLGRQSEGGKE